MHIVCILLLVASCLGHSRPEKDGAFFFSQVKNEIIIVNQKGKQIQSTV